MTLESVSQGTHWDRCHLTGCEDSTAPPPGCLSQRRSPATNPEEAPDKPTRAAARAVLAGHRTSPSAEMCTGVPAAREAAQVQPGTHSHLNQINSTDSKHTMSIRTKLPNTRSHSPKRCVRLHLCRLRTTTVYKGYSNMLFKKV